MTLRLGTRGSALALCQARAVAASLTACGVEVAVEVITTTGDTWTGSLASVGGKGLSCNRSIDKTHRSAFGGI